MAYSSGYDTYLGSQPKEELTNTALIIVDPLVDFVSGKTRCVEAESVLESINEHILATKENDIAYAAIFCARDCHDDPSQQYGTGHFKVPSESKAGNSLGLRTPPFYASSQISLLPHAVAGTPGAEIDPHLDITELDDFVWKGAGWGGGRNLLSGKVVSQGFTSDGYLEENTETLDVLLVDFSIGNLVFCGLAMEQSLIPTAEEACFRRFNSFVLPDLCAPLHEKWRDPALNFVKSAHNKVSMYNSAAYIQHRLKLMEDRSEQPVS